MKRETITILYGMLVCLMVLVLGLAYANVTTELKIEGKTEGEEQDGVYITEVEYLTNSGADITVDADLADYGDYKIEQSFEIEIITCSHTWQEEICTICGKVCSHNYGEWQTTTEATCGATGTKTKTCTVCGVTTSETIAKLTTHSYGSWTVTKAATCTTAGSQKRTCSVCGTSQTQSIAATGECSYSKFYYSQCGFCTPSITARCDNCKSIFYITDGSESSYGSTRTCDYCGWTDSLFCYYDFNDGSEILSHGRCGRAWVIQSPNLPVNLVGYACYNPDDLTQCEICGDLEGFWSAQ